MAEISIIVPIYNDEHYLRQCIESILNQTYGDFELILVNDGSSDKSGEICDQFAIIDKRIRVIHQRNRGVSAARNAGISASKGKFLCFVDGDDLLSSEFCETMICLVKTVDVSFASASILRFEKENDLNDLIKKNENKNFLNGIKFLEKQLCQGFSVCGKLFRADIFDSLSFCEGKRYEDIIFMIDLAKKMTNNVCCIDTELYYYRQNSNSFMFKSKKTPNPERVYAGIYLYNSVRALDSELSEKAFEYAVSDPWSYIDGIYVGKTFRENREFIIQLRQFLKDNVSVIDRCGYLTPIIKKRMRIFTHSMILYGINAYARLLRVYVYHVIGKDAYSDGHGI